MGRFADAVRTLLTPGWDSQLRRAAAELERQKSEVRALTTELADNMEKFSMLLAREAKRRAREQKKIIDGEPEKPVVPDQVVSGVSGKDAIWRRLRAQGGAPPLPLFPSVSNEPAE